MTKRFFRKLLIAFSGGLLFICGAIYACGGWEYDWELASNFTPEAFVGKSYSALFLSQLYFYNDEGLQNNNLFDSENIKDWDGYLKNKLSHDSVKFFLIDSSAADVNGLYDFYQSGKRNAATEKWASKLDLKDKQTKNFIEFLYSAKKVEQASVTKDLWQYDTIVYQSITDKDLLLNIRNTYKSTQDKFLKDRYWFQTVKAYFYSDQKQAAADFFNATEKTMPRNVLYYRALSYVAGVHYNQNNFTLANYLYSRVFDKCPELRAVAAYNFHPQEEADWQQSLALAKTNDEKAALWAIYGYYNDEKKAIENIFRLKPDSPHLDFLLTRLINNEEMKSALSVNPDYEDQPREPVLENTRRAVLDLVVEIAGSGKISNQYLWNAAAGYLEIISGNFEKADLLFDRCEKQLPGTALAKNQLRLLRLVNQLSKITNIRRQDETALLDNLQWLYQGLPEYGDSLKFRHENAANWSRNYLSSLYKAQGDSVMSELFVRGPRFYNAKENLVSMKAFLKKPEKSPFEKLALSLYDVSLEDIYEYEAIQAAFRNKIPESVALMKQTGNLKDEVFLGDPFDGKIQDCHECDHAAPQARKYTLLQFLETVADLQKKLSRNNDVYKNSLLLGNAFYNITNFGNGRVFYQSNIFGLGDSNNVYAPEDSVFMYDCTIAKNYYSKALAAAKNDEQRAKCQYMIAKCERNDGDYDGDNFYYGWNSFKILKKRYSKTKYYREIINQCGYFRTFLSHSN
ncbi:MAG: hypothetical protein EOO48_04655 [Flavobacterium sp.]|nr:MAG: hypothetical protein EOO48_04655 [Flavobacterium sp.]